MAEKSLIEEISDALQEEVPSLPTEKTADAVLCVLAMRLSGGEAGHLVENLPDELRSALRICVSHPSEPTPHWDLGTFRDLVANHLGITGKDVQLAIDIVLSAVRRHMDPEDARHLHTQLPSELRALWDASA